MTIEEGIKLQGRPAEIPDCGRDDLVKFFKDRGFKKGVEIGVYKGEFSEILAGYGGELFSVDPWRLYEDYGNPRGQARLDEQFRHTTERLSKYPNVKIIRKASMEALADFEDESLDFVYIDGNHQFPYVAQDMYFWARKLKKGGILCGHDYARYKSVNICGGCHAKEIVDAYVQAFNIRNFWIIGRYKVPEGEKRDQWRSWMIIKDYDTPKHVVPN
jgi:SAM-dependent methyltransferase